MGKNLLLTGSDGFTGLHLLKAASAQGYNVIELKSDLTDNEAVQQELSGQDIHNVIHLAAISAVTHADQMELYRVNLFGTLSLLQALSEQPQPPNKIVIASSANIYGNCPESPIAETALPAPVNHYAMSKLAMEHMARNLAEVLPIVTTRPFNYTGVGHDDRFVVPKIIAHFKDKRSTVELGNIQVEREFNDVRTVCEAYLALLEKGQPGEAYNICSGQTYSLTQVIDTLRNITGHTLSVEVNQAFVRANEVQRLCGDPGKLTACVGQLDHPKLTETLAWMLEA